MDNGDDFWAVCRYHKKLQWCDEVEPDYPEIICVEIIPAKPDTVAGEVYLYLYSDIIKGIDEFKSKVKEFDLKLEERLIDAKAKEVYGEFLVHASRRMLDERYVVEKSLKKLLKLASKDGYMF